MIVKGKPRSGPEQLAAYLMRTADGEHPTLLQLQYGDGDLRKAFLDWHAVGEGTRGEYTLYHAQIAPDPRYKLTPEQCLRAAEILAEDLGMKDHPRAVVLHDGHDKPHVHVVFMRTNIDTMKMWDDGKNYLKHERASHRMELEFGHELVPGKHKVKRNREKQPEFPRAKSDQADYQQANRTGMSFDERKAELAGIRKSCDDAPAFKNALEEAGYILAKGEKRGFVVVDRDGEVFSLSKHLASDIKGKEYKAFMAPLDQAALPTVEEAKALHKQREEEAAAKAERPAPEASKFLTPAAPEKAPEPTPAPPVSKFLAPTDAPVPVSPPPALEVKPFDYELYANWKPAPQAPVVELPAPDVAPQQAPDQPASKFLPTKEPAQPTPTAEKPTPIDITLYAPKAPAPTPPSPPAPVRPQVKEPVPPAPEPTTAPDSGAPAYDWTGYALKPEFKGMQPPPPPRPKRPREERDVFDLRRSIWTAQKEEYNGFIEQNAADYKQHGATIDNANVWKMEDFDHKQRADLQDFRERLSPEPRKGAAGMLDKVHRALNPQDDDALRQEELALFRSQQAHDRRDYIKVLEQDKLSELEKFRDRQLAEQAAREGRYNEEIERRIAEFKEAKRLKAELEADERQRQRGRDREGAAPTTQRREPLPSDPWMAQIGGIAKLSPDHLASAQRSYDAWSRKQEYSFENYVSYVQRQWEKVELPPVPQAAAPQPPKPAYDPTTYEPKAAPKTDPWTDAEIKSKFSALQGDPEIERRIAEFKEGRRIAAELEADARKREKDRDREGPEPPEEGKE